MAYPLGSLNPSICARLEQADTLLIHRADTHVLSQVLIEHELLKEDDWIDKNMVSTDL